MNQGEENKLSKKERKTLKRQEKQAFQKKERQKKKMKQTAVWAIVIVIILGAGAGLWKVISGSGPQGQDFSVSYPVQGRSHVQVGSAHPSYNSNPPTSGWHYSQPARTGVYEEELDEEQIVHNLEHGDIWISYHPRVSQDVVEELKDLVDSKVLLAPREANDIDIAVAAWGRLDKFNLNGEALDKTRIRDFISRYRNQGPEKVSPIR